MKLTGITWITTYNCNLACDHCFFETKGSKKYMDSELVDRAFVGLENTRHMFWQHLSGGEIFLDEQRLFQIIKNIRKYFKKDIGLSTNAFWAKNEVETCQKVNQLAEMGVSGIALSADYYHQKYMSIEGPKTLARVIKQSGLKTHSYIMGARLNADIDNAETINQQSEQIADEVDQRLELPYARATERSIGKGCLINRPKKIKIPQGKCTELNTCLGERSPFNPAMVWIDPYGNVMICYGIIIGNLYNNSLNDIIGDYSPEKFPLLQELSLEGPKTLHEIALSKDNSMPSEFYDECDVCYRSRSVLQKHYPDVLGPKECYPV